MTISTTNLVPHQNVANVFDGSQTLLNNQTVIYVVPDDEATKAFTAELKGHEALQVFFIDFVHRNQSNFS